MIPKPLVRTVSDFDEGGGTGFSLPKRLTYQTFIDNRGMTSPCYYLSTTELPRCDYRQDTVTFGLLGAFRGFHGSMIERKLFTLIYGSIQYFILDCRRGSKTFRKVVEFTESAKNAEIIQFSVPPGFAHGFLPTSDMCIVYYKRTLEFEEKNEFVISPLDIFSKEETKNLTISERDMITTYPRWKE